MSVNTSIGLIGAALQTDKNSPALEPRFVHGLTGGRPFSLDRSVESAEVACGVRSGTDSYVSSVISGVDFETYGYSDAIALYFYAAMGNIVSSASGDNHEHVITLGDSIPYLTFWGRIGDEYTRTDGCKIDSLEMSFEGNAPLEFGITCIGLDSEMGLNGFPGDVDPSCFDGYYVPTGGTFKLDTASDTPAEAPVMSGSLTLSNACTAEPLAGRVNPGSVDEGKLTVSGSVSVKPEDLSLYKRMVTGSDDGTKPSGKMVYGSFEWMFEHSQNPAFKLKINSGRVPFSAEFPEVDPAGGAAQIEFSFDEIGVNSAAGSPITVSVINEVEKYV